ncbi:MAG: cysteine synthase [uncultured archaeon A07HR60]|nr:MAG: cysteine synthase [uncultured archaeon A07HR60]
MSDVMQPDETAVFETPLLRLDLGLDSDATVLGKAEWYNLPDAPYGGGSIKTRIAKGMLDGAEASGALTEGDTVIEPTSGNTGSEIARLATARGYDVEIVMPDNASGGKVNAVQDTGAQIHFVDADLGYDAVIERCEELIAANPEKYYRPNQYENPDNPGTHERTTAAEIWEATDGGVTHFVAGAGTGGTITGTGRGLHDRSDDEVTIVGFEPDDPLHAIDGLKYLKTGDHYHPDTYDESAVDEKLYITTTAAYDTARALRERYLDAEVPVYDSGRLSERDIRRHLRVEDQFLVGTSAGAGAAAVKQLDRAGTLDDDDTVVFMLCDRGDKYADIPLWEEYLSGS